MSDTIDVNVESCIPNDFDMAKKKINLQDSINVLQIIEAIHHATDDGSNLIKTVDCKATGGVVGIICVASFQTYFIFYSSLKKQRKKYDPRMDKNKSILYNKTAVISQGINTVTPISKRVLWLSVLRTLFECQNCSSKILRTQAYMLAD